MHWPLGDAGTRLAEILDAALTEGPQFITKDGVEVAVLVSIEEWKHLTGSANSNASPSATGIKENISDSNEAT